MDIKKDIKIRVYVAFTGILLFAIAIVVKAAAIQFSEGDQLKLQAQKAHTRKEKLDATRGNIYTEDGQLLSSTIPQFDIRIDFGAINKDTFNRYVDTLSQLLSKVFTNTSAIEFKQNLKSAFRNKERYWLLENKIPYNQYQTIRNFPIFNKGKNRGGFIAEANSTRVNPYGWLGYRTIGLWRENVPNIGLESSYDTALSGKAGSRIARKTTGGVWIPLKGSEIDPVNGKDIVTTLDIDIQNITENALLASLEKNKCQYGTAIVMEVKTGKIRAIANLGLQKDGTYAEDFNYALLATEPGSTFKLMTLYSLLEDGDVNINTKVNTYGGRRMIGGQIVRDDHGGLGTISIRQAYAHSSNVAFASLAYDYYENDPMKFINHLQFLRLNKHTGIDIQGESRSLIKTTKSKSWNKNTSIAWIGYGYESLVTPLQTLMVYSTVANNGKMMKPYLVSAIKEYGKTIDTFKPTVLINEIGKPSTIQQLKEVTRAVVDSGTARGIKSPYYNFGGKTGTAQIADKGISYADQVRQGSFVGYFPYENPQYSIVVLVRSTPHGAYYGATVAAPVFKAIADRIYNTKIGGWSVDKADSQAVLSQTFVAKKSTSKNIYTILHDLGIYHQAPISAFKIADISFDNTGKLILNHTSVNGATAPDVTGMGLKDALYILESEGLKVNIQGVGKVISQSITPGNKIQKGQQINLQLG